MYRKTRLSVTFDVDSSTSFLQVIFVSSQPMATISTIVCLSQIRFMTVHTCGLDGSTVPLLLAVSGLPSPFLLFSGLLDMSVECFVSVFEIPSCFPDIIFLLPGGFDAVACSIDSQIYSLMKLLIMWLFRTLSDLVPSSFRSNPSSSTPCRRP